MKFIYRSCCQEPKCRRERFKTIKFTTSIGDTSRERKLSRLWREFSTLTLVQTLSIASEVDKTIQARNSVATRTTMHEGRISHLTPKLAKNEHMSSTTEINRVLIATNSLKGTEATQAISSNLRAWTTIWEVETTDRVKLTSSLTEEVGINNMVATTKVIIKVNLLNWLTLYSSSVK